MKTALDYCGQSGRLRGTKVAKVLEDTEPVTFKSNFKKWSEPVSTTFGYSLKGKPRTVSDSGEQIVASMLQGTKEAILTGNKRSSKALDDVQTINVEVWRIEDFKEVPLEKDFYGQLHAGDLYTVKHTYQEGSKTGYIIYSWQGSMSSLNEKKAPPQ